MASCAEECPRTDVSSPDRCQVRLVFNPTYASFPRGGRPQRAARVQWPLLALALAFPTVVGLVGIPRLYGYTAVSSPALTVNRPLVGAQPVLKRPAAAVSDPQPDVALEPSVLSPSAVVTATPVPPTLQRTYTVQRGDELRHIAAEHGVTMRSLLEINELPDPDRLRIGQVLRLPDP